MAAQILFAGGEDTSFTFVGAVAVDTNASLFRSGFAREDIEVQPAAAADPPTNRFMTHKFVDTTNNNLVTSFSHFWVHATFAWGALGGDATNNAAMFRLLDDTAPTAVGRIAVRGAGSGAMKISKRDSVGTFTDLVTSANGVLPVTGLSPAQVDFRMIDSGPFSDAPDPDISFAAGPPGVITTAGADFLVVGFVEGCQIVVSGSASNDGTYDTGAITSSTMTIPGVTLVNESSGATVTISSTGRATLYFKGEQVADFVGDTTTDGVNSLLQVEFADCDTGHPLSWSEIIVSLNDTRGKGLFTMYPTAAGNTQQWLPNTVANVSKAVIDDSTYVTTGTAPETSDWLTNETLPPGAWLVDAVITEARVLAGPGGPQNFEWVIEQSGTIQTQGTVALTPDFTNYGWVWPQNPAVGADWTSVDLTTGSIDLGIESLP